MAIRSEFLSFFLVVTDGRTDLRTDGQTKRLIEMRGRLNLPESLFLAGTDFVLSGVLTHSCLSKDEGHWSVVLVPAWRSRLSLAP